MTVFHELHDFSHYSNFGSDPHRAEQLRIASTLDLGAIRVDVWNGPIGGHGFRRGYWNAEYQGKKYRFFSSVSHSAELDDQKRFLVRDAALYIAGVLSGYIAEPAAPAE